VLIEVVVKTHMGLIIN